jgi:hypothetical protein
MESVSVILVVLGLTQFIKEKLNLSGRPAELLSFAIGFFIGGASRLASLPTMPLDFTGWFAVVLYALAAALVPSGLYKFTSEFRAATK